MRSHFALNVNYYHQLYLDQQNQKIARQNPFFEDTETVAASALPPAENTEETLSIPARDFEWFVKIREQIAKLKNKNFRDSMQFIFENFNYDSEPAPFDAYSLEKFVDRYDALLASGMVIKLDDENYQVGERHLKEIEKFVVELYQYACSEILDEFCEIKPEIFAALGLEAVPRDWLETNQARQSEVCRQLLLAYFQKVLMPVIKSEWEIAYYKAHVARQPDLLTIVYLSKYMNQICEQDVHDELKKIATTSTLASNDKQLVKSCERFFRAISLKDFEAIVARDLSSQIAWPVELRANVKEVKIQFWNAVAGLSLSADKVNFINDFIKSVTVIKKSLFAKAPAPVPVENYPIYPLAKNPELYKRFLVRDNQIIIRYLLSVIRETQAKAEAKNTRAFILGDLTAIEKLNAAETSMHYLTWETKYLLPLFINDCQQTGKLRILLNYTQQFLGKFKTLTEMAAPPDAAKQISNGQRLRPQ